MRSIHRTVVAAIASALAATVAVVPTSAAGPAERASRLTDWTRLSPSINPNFAEAATARTPDGLLHVVWGVDPGNFEHTTIDPRGRQGAVSRVLAADWSSVTARPDLEVMPDGSLRLFFTGWRTGGTADFFDAKGVYNAVSTDGGATWAVPTEIYARAVGGGDNAEASVLPDGQVLTGFGDTAGFHFRIGAGDNANAAPESVNTDVPIAGGVEFTTVTSSGAVWLTYSAGDNRYARTLWPTVGEPITPPLTTGYSYAGVPVVDREGVGPVAAFEAGYGTTNEVYVWDIARNQIHRVPGFRGPNNVFIGTATDSHLWVGASGPIGYTPRAARVARTGWAVDRKPTKLSDSYTTYDGTIVGLSGMRAEMIMSGRIESADPAEGMLSHSVQSSMWVKATPRRWRVGRAQRVKFVVKDVDGAVRTALVKADGRRCTTNAAGTCRIAFSSYSRPKKIRVKVTEPGYDAVKLVLKVKR